MKGYAVLRRSLIGGLLLLAAISGAVCGKAFVSLESEIALLSADSLVDLDSTFLSFQAGYYSGDVALLSNRFLRTLFLSDGSLTEKGFGVQTIIDCPMYATDQAESLSFSVYAKSDLVIDWPIGTWSVISNVAFSMLSSDLSRWWSTANVSAYGTSTTLTFVLVPTPMGTTTGLSIELSGPSLSGMGVAIGAHFGSLPPSTSCDLNFREATVGFKGFLLGCLALDIETTIGGEGYESTVMGFNLDMITGQLTIEGEIEFSIEEKSLTLIPRLQLDSECIWVNVGFDPEVWEEVVLIDALHVRGMGLSGVTIGSVQCSGIFSFIGGVYREIRANNLNLRAGNYYVAIDPEADASKYMLLPYDMIVSVEYSEGNSDLALDVYFGSPELDLFDLALITAEWTHQMSDQLEFYLGASLDPNGADTTFALGFEAAVFLL